MKALILSSLVLSLSLVSQASDVQKKDPLMDVKMTKLNLVSIAMAMQLYETDCRSYPEMIKGLFQNLEDCANWGPHPYLNRNTKLVDEWGRSFLYERQGARFSLKSLGRDGKTGGEGLDADLDVNDIL